MRQGLAHLVLYLQSNPGPDIGSAIEHLPGMYEVPNTVLGISKEKYPQTSKASKTNENYLSL